MMQAPVYIGELEISESLAGICLPAREGGAAYTGALLLVKVQRIPVGYAFLTPEELDADSIAEQVWRQLSAGINAQRSQAGLPPADSLSAAGMPMPATARGAAGRPMVSVVMCTRDRPESAITALRNLVALRYEPFEVIVVDNAPSTDATREAVQAEFGGNPLVRYVAEPRPGLSCARNRGVQEAAADIVAFTDDDVEVDPWWIDGIARGFAEAPGVACVTGLIATAQLENESQLYFHLREGWGTECERRLFDLAEHRDDSPLYPYSAGIFGAGANFAISRPVLKELGGFDEALGAGTRSGGGEDLDMFMRVILSGHSLVYEPSAVVWHYHRTDLADLEKQMRAYGSGLTAALVAIMLKYRRARIEIPLKAVRGALRILQLNDRVKDNPSLPAGLMRREIIGMLAGPRLYLMTRRKG
jgi:GT2 family glycosyltransferase